MSKKLPIQFAPTSRAQEFVVRRFVDASKKDHTPIYDDFELSTIAHYLLAQTEELQRQLREHLKEKHND